MICPICKNEIEEDSKFCPICGKLIPRCPSCNKVITNEMRFCIYDGTPLPKEIFSAFTTSQTANSIETSQQIKKEDTTTEKVPTKKKKWILPFLCILFFMGIIIFLGYFMLSGNSTLEIFSHNINSNPKKDSYNHVKTFIDESTMEEAETGQVSSHPTDILEQAESVTQPYPQYEPLQDNESYTLPEKEQSTEQETFFTESSNTEIEVSTVSMDVISSVFASSYLSESEYGLVHHPSNLIDGTLANAWVEDASGQGEGESVTLQFDGTYKLSGFTINAGYQKNDDVYTKNSRPATLTVIFSDGNSMNITLEDIDGQQTITFPSSVETSNITLIIQSVYQGSKYQDTAISEIELF